MLFKLTLLVAVSAVLVVGFATAIELVELSDANRALLSLDMAKSLRIVQDGYSKGFKFEKVAEARKFVEECKDLKASLSSVSDADFQGLAGKIKTVLDEPNIEQACSIKVNKFDQFDILDEKAGEYSYLSNKRLAAITDLSERLKRHPKLKVVLSHLFEKTKELMAQQLLSNAPKDTEIYFGELKDSSHYKAACEIAKVKPICQFARRTNESKVSAIGADFADLKGVIESGDQAKLSFFAEASGVSVDDLKKACNSIKRDLHPIRHVDKCADANLLSEQQILDKCKNNPDFSFYYQLSQLCLTQE